MLHRISSRQAPSGPAILALGFRPFFLAAALLAALWIPLWLLALRGTIAAGLDAHWHGHEMVFGFALAVVAGFLLTAARNWTGQPSPSGMPLLTLLLLWVAGRVAFLFSATLPLTLVTALDLAFVPAVTFFVARMVVRAKNWRNLGFVVLLSILTATNAWFWLGDPARANLLGVFIVIQIIVLMGGRIIPSFTANATGIPAREKNALDWAAFGLTALTAVFAVALPTEPATNVVAGAAGIANLARMWGWGSLRTAGKPLVWILHVGYFFVPLGLILRGLDGRLPGMTGTAPLHALTAGAIGCLTLGMMSRVALGHTGRQLQASRLLTAGYIAVLSGALVRVFGAGFFPEHYMTLLIVAGVLWSAGFAIYLVEYVPILVRPRLDGKAG